MKLFFTIAAALLVVGLIGWATVDSTGFRHTFAGYSNEEIEQTKLKFDTTQAQIQNRLDERLLETKIRLVELVLGEAAAGKYEMCHKYPPTTKQHKADCQKLDERVAKIEAQQAKDPW